MGQKPLPRARIADHEILPSRVAKNRRDPFQFGSPRTGKSPSGGDGGTQAVVAAWSDADENVAEILGTADRFLKGSEKFDSATPGIFKVEGEDESISFGDSDAATAA